MTVRVSLVTRDPRDFLWRRRFCGAIRRRHRFCVRVAGSLITPFPFWPKKSQVQSRRFLRLLVLDGPSVLPFSRVTALRLRTLDCRILGNSTTKYCSCFVIWPPIPNDRVAASGTWFMWRRSFYIALIGRVENACGNRELHWWRNFACDRCFCVVLLWCAIGCGFVHCIVAL